jgi:hypothetical protein
MPLRRAFPRTFSADALIPLAIFTLALAVRMHLLQQYEFPLMLHEQDAVGYMRIAGSLLHFSGEGLVGRPPVYPAVIALCSLFTNNMEYAARFASILMDALVCIPLYGLARIVLSRVSAALAATFWAFFSYALYFSISPLSQSTWLFFALAGLCALAYALRSPDHQQQFMIVSGICFALSYLTRPEGLLGFCFGLFVYVTTALYKRIPWRTVLKMALIYTAVFMLCTAPYFIYLKVQLGAWDVSSKTSAALKGQDGMLTLTAAGTLPKAASGLNPWIEYYQNIPRFIEVSMQNFKHYFNNFLQPFPLWLHLLGLAGMIMLMISAPWEALLLSILFLMTLPNYIVNISKTLSYLYSIFPLYFICTICAFELSGKAVARLFRSIPEQIPRFSALAAATVITVWFSFSSYRQAHGYLDEPGLRNEALLTRHIFMDASRFIQGVSAKTDVIMTRWGLISYYSGLPTTGLPKGTASEVLAFGRKSGATWLLIDSPSVYSRRQELKVLLNPDEAAPLLKQYGVVPVHAGGMDGLGMYVVYRYQ